jgi:hypothetical protein
LILEVFAADLHPSPGSIMVMTSDLNRAAIQVIEIFGPRFRIEASFKPATAKRSG